MGAYLNPVVNIYRSKWVDLYFSGHIEILYRTETTQDLKGSIRKDTFTVTPQEVASSIRINAYPGILPAYSKRSYQDVFLGYGLPVNINIKNIFTLYLEPTAGLAFYNRNNISYDTRNGITYRLEERSSSAKFFLLTKAQLSTKVSTGLGLTLGGEFRRIAAVSNIYALYLGLNIPLEKLLK